MYKSTKKLHRSLCNMHIDITQKMVYTIYRGRGKANS